MNVQVCAHKNVRIYSYITVRGLTLKASLVSSAASRMPLMSSTARPTLGYNTHRI